MRRSPMPPRRTRLKDTPLERTSEPTRSRLRAPGTPARPDRGWNSTLPASRKPLKQTRHRKAFRHLRDEPYKAHVRAMPCLLAGRPGHECRGRVEFSHVANEGNGAPDFANGLPLCSHAGHRYGSKCWHVMGRESWQAYWGIDAVGEAIRIATDYRGVAA